MLEENSHIFALDIGTRSIVGILAKAVGDKLEIIDCEIIEHQERSMLDGQIHDVLKVTDVIKEIKNRIETKNNITLEYAAVAAAGRSLKTMRLKLKKSVKDKAFTTRDEVLAFELEAVQAAQKKLVQENEGVDSTRYHCVGYSVVSYLIDGSPISNIIEQYGDEIEIDVIATFLPRVVVDSLQAALERADLEISGLTLEPIAAINVLIPATMRKLNLCLVDIGAGTSDIAITAEGTITAFDMVPSAGDEITEAISQKYLLDFNIAEGVKRSLGQKKVKFFDVLGFEVEKPSQDIIAEIRSSIDNLAQQIADRILELNKNAPQAVILIGGGSMTPLLPQLLAKKLDLPRDRVAVRGCDAIANLISCNEKLVGPEAVTPIGIAMTARDNSLDFINIYVNEKKVRVFDLKKLTIADALLASGVQVNRLQGKPGLAMSVEVNGHLRIVRGQYGEPPIFLLNDEEVSLEHIVVDGDKIHIIPGQQGLDAEAIIADVLEANELEPLTIKYETETHQLPVIVWHNGKIANIEDKLDDRDCIICHKPSTVKECLVALNVAEQGFDSEQDINLKIDDKPVVLKGGKKIILVNNNKADLYTKIYDNDVINIKVEQQKQYRIQDVIPDELISKHKININVNGEKVSISHPGFFVQKNGKFASMETTISDGDKISLGKKEHLDIIFNDIFKYVDIMNKKPEDATRLEIKLNNEPATYDSLLNEGDIVELKWK